MRCNCGWLIALALAVIWMPLTAVLAGPEELAVAHVKLRVLDPNGWPMPNATVKAFSEDWYHPSPIDGFARTDDRGEVTLPVVVGRWSFYSGAEPPWINQNAGEGQFLSMRGVEIKGDTTLEMRPSKTILLHVRGADNMPRNTMFFAMSSAAVPVVTPPACGWTQDGDFLLHVTDDGPIDLLCHADSSPAQMGLHLLAKNVAVGSEVMVRPTQQNACLIHARFVDEQQRPLRSDLNVSYRDFAVGETTGFGRAGLCRSLEPRTSTFRRALWVSHPR